MDTSFPTTMPPHQQHSSLFLNQHTSLIATAKSSIPEKEIANVKLLIHGENSSLMLKMMTLLNSSPLSCGFISQQCILRGKLHKMWVFGMNVQMVL